MGFGKRVEKSETPQCSVAAVHHASKAQYVYLMCAFAALAVSVSLYMSIVILRVPIERPFGGLFNSKHEDIFWAPVWVAPLTSLVLAMLLLFIPGKTKTRLSVLNVGLLSFGVVCLSAMMTRFVMNVGFTIITKHASLREIVSVAVPMLRRNAIIGLFELTYNAWFLMLLPIVVAAGWRTVD